MFLDAPCSSRICLPRKGERLQHSGGSDLSPSRPFPIRSIELLCLESSTRSPLIGCPQPLTSERLTLASADRMVLTTSLFNKEPLLQYLQWHLHTLPRKCVKWWSPTTNNALLQQLNVMENPRHQSQVHPLLPSQWIQISVWKFHFNNWHLPSLTAKVTFQILHQKSQDTSSLIWNQHWQKYTLSDLFKDSFLC